MNAFTILNTRPAHQSKILTDILLQLGATVLHLPLFDITPLSFSPFNLADFSHLIFQSQNAAIQFLTIQKNIPDFISIIAIGSATKRALQAAGYHNVLIPDHFSSEGVLMMPIMQYIQNQSILIISGENPKPLLRTSLSQRGANITTCACYQRTPITHDASVAFEKISLSDMIITTSSESLAQLLFLFDAVHQECLFSKKLIVISEKMKQDALSAGFQTVIQTDNATDEEIAKAVYILINQYKIA